jgi:hypothetical protein
MQPPEPADKLLEDLQSAQAYMRLAAAFELGRRSPAEPATLEALRTAAETDTDTAVRSAAGKSYRDLTGAGQSQSSDETTPGTIGTPKPNGGLASVGKFVAAAILSFGLNWAVGWVIYSQGEGLGAGFLVVIGINALLAIWLRSVRQHVLAAGVLAGLVAVLVAVLALVAYVIRNFRIG